MTKNTVNDKKAEILQNTDFTTMRRTDREVTDAEWIKNMLHQGSYGTLGTEHDGQPFLNVNNYVYDEQAHALYIHRAKIGRTSTNLEANPRVCYSVSQMGQIKTDEEAVNFGVEYQSVIIFGQATLVDDEAEASHALQLLLEKYAPDLSYGVDYQPFSSNDVKRTAVYKIAIEQWSGKQLVHDEEA